MYGFRGAITVMTVSALVAGGLLGPGTPAAASAGPDGGRSRPGDPRPAADPARAATTFKRPVAGTSATIEFADTGAAVRSADLSPHLTQIVREAERLRTVDIDPDALAPSLRAESVTVELFDDVRVELRTTVALSRGAAVGGTVSRVYAAAGEDTAAAVTVIDGDLHGVFWQGATRYGIEPLGGGRHLVFEDGRTFPDEAPPVAARRVDTAAPPTSAPADVSPLSTTVIDILVAFDNSAQAEFGSVAAIEDEIVEMVNLANVVYANSEIDVQLALTDILDVDYTPNASDGTTNYQTYLNAIRSKVDGIVDVVHTARDAGGADLVAMISDLTGACGVGSLPVSTDPAELSAYTLTDGLCAVGNLSFPHEVGHNLCAHHDPPNAPGNPCDTDAFAHYSAAAGLRTVMAYANDTNGCVSCTRIPYFSNPDVAYSGWTTGVLGSRDNARVIRSRAADVAAYRSPGTGGPAPCQVTYTITATWSGNVQVSLLVENLTSTTLNGWTAEWTFTGDEDVYNSWGVTVSQVGPAATATGDGYGATVPALGSVTVGFQATVTGTPTVPATVTCDA